MGASESGSDQESGGDAGETETLDQQPTDEPEPTAQATALRRQQRYAAGGGSLLAGLAVTISIVQRFPEYSAVAVLAGLVSALVVYRLAANSIFPGEES